MDNLPDIKKDYLQLYSVTTCLQLFKKVNTALDACKAECDSLAEIKKNSSDTICMRLLQVWIVSLNDFVNTSRKMNPSQITEACNYIYQDYHYMKMSDIYLVITRIKKGYYGQLYESLDGVKLLSFFENYANERADESFEDNYREHDKLKYLEEKPLRKNKIGQ